MNERRAIESMKDNPHYRATVGSAPSQITPSQQRAANLIGRLLIHAKKRGKRKNFSWI